MAHCAQCGHPLGIGRFCTNCGQPVEPPPQAPTQAPDAAPTEAPAGRDADTDWRTDTAERPRFVDVPPTDEEQPTRPPADSPWGVPPPPVHASPPPARYPLYAGDPAPASLAPEPLAHASAASPDRGSRARGAVWWTVGIVVLVLVAGLGAFLLLRGNGDDAASRDANPTESGSIPTSAPPTSEAPTTSSTPSPTPSPKPTKSPTPSGPPAEVVRHASVRAPRSAPPGRSVTNQPVRYDAANMLDGNPSTAWRMVGDGVGREITITLQRRTDLASVGLINGYAKQEPGYDGYHANRRITSVQWVFDGGRRVSESLRSTRRMQSIDVSGITTKRITLRLLAVSAPAEGKTGRDYTAISDLSVVGSTG